MERLKGFEKQILKEFKVEIKSITIKDLVKMSTAKIKIDFNDRYLYIDGKSLGYFDCFLIDCITDIKKCDDIVVINIPYGSFFRDKKVKIDFKNSIIATPKETFC